ncbi:MAG: 23S rRNA (uracil(1939)-C(5))-methyltransferase RlmD [Lachnospiraceae bacterium]|nr:23S rRNA (uracil(1939)-C(5))-methyltransferase RlmD [Candidatus Merdinaster equi]
MGDFIYKKNDLTTVSITDLGNDGEGIGRVDGYTLFVKDALIGDTVEARILKPKKSYAYAKTERIISPSEHRVVPPCPVSRQCGGCQLQSLSYERELRFKEDKVRNNLIRIGGFSPEELEPIFEPIVGSDPNYRYRNKALYPIGKDKEGNPVAGFYAGRTHSIIPCEDCLLGDERNKNILNAILATMQEKNIPPYDEETQTGIIRHVLIRSSRESSEMLVCIIINSDTLPSEASFIDNIRRAVENVSSISININKKNTNVVMGDTTKTIWGNDTISDSIRIYNSELSEFTGKSISYHISPRSFYQVNPYQTEKLYSLALSYAGLTGKEAVWDLYCGIGTISLFLAGNAGKVYGVEIVPEAIADAKENAKRNGIDNAEFFTGKAEEILPEFYDAETHSDPSLSSASNSGSPHNSPNYDMKSPDVIVVDPPRKGCDEACLETMLRMSPNRIVYVSCDSASLARDLRILCDGGYSLQKVRPVDQFSHTVHVETVCLLSRKAPV